MVSNHNTVQITTSGGASDGGFLGIFSTAPVTAIAGDTYQNSTTGDLYYYDGASWVLIPLASGGADGGHLGLLATAPSGAIAGDQYYNTTDGTTYQFDGTVWTQIPSGGNDGGFLGIFATAPVTAIDGDQYYNSTNGIYYYYNSGVWNPLPKGSEIVRTLNYIEGPSAPYIFNYRDTDRFRSYIAFSNPSIISVSVRDTNTGVTKSTIITAPTLTPAPQQVYKCSAVIINNVMYLCVVFASSYNGTGYNWRSEVYYMDLLSGVLTPVVCSFVGAPTMGTNQSISGFNIPTITIKTDGTNIYLTNSAGALSLSERVHRAFTVSTSTLTSFATYTFDTSEAQYGYGVFANSGHVSYTRLMTPALNGFREYASTGGVSLNTTSTTYSTGYNYYLTSVNGVAYYCNQVAPIGATTNMSLLF